MKHIQIFLQLDGLGPICVRSFHVSFTFTNLFFYNSSPKTKKQKLYSVHFRLAASEYYCPFVKKKNQLSVRSFYSETHLFFP